MPATYAMQYRWAIEKDTIAKIEAKLVQFAVYIKGQAGYGAGNRAAYLTLAEEIVNGGQSAVKAARMALIMASADNIINTLFYDPETGSVRSSASDADFSSQLENKWPVLAGVTAA